MPRKLTDVGSYVKGAVCTKDKGYLVLAVDEMVRDHHTHSVLVLWRRGEVFKVCTEPWYTAGVAALHHDQGQMIVVGEYGNVVVAGAGQLQRETIGGDQSSPRKLGPLRAIKVIGTHAYAVGMRRQVYRRQAPNLWTEFADGISQFTADASGGLEAIDGFSETDLYAVGWEGEIWASDGRRWKPVVSPTNLILTGVCCGGDDFVYACGQGGLLIKGRGEQWEVIETEGVKEDIWGIAWFKGAVYLATLRGLWRLGKAGTEAVRTGSDPASTFYSLSVADDVLWSIGAKDVMAFDGEKWTRIE